MNRRVFLTLGTTVSAGFVLWGVKGEQEEPMWQTLQDIQNHLFPQNGDFPSAEGFASVRYLKMVSRHESFDQADLTFIFKGVVALQERGWRTVASKEEKEQILEVFSQTTFGENWIAMVLNYIFEALLSDPIYGGNVHQKGWESLSHHPGSPRPKQPFARLS